MSPSAAWRRLQQKVELNAADYLYQKMNVPAGNSALLCLMHEICFHGVKCVTSCSLLFFFYWHRQPEAGVTTVLVESCCVTEMHF